jgi:DNA-binding CsgD family transcriptional regulator
MKPTTRSTTLLTKNKVGLISPEDQRQLDDYLEVTKSFARLTYTSLYIIDYATMSFEYVSDNPLFLCGYSPEQVQAMGYDFYFKHVPEKDLRLLELINELGFDFFEQLPLHQKKHYHITYDFHLLNQQGKAILINHKLTPLFLTQHGKLWKAMCLVSLSSHHQAGNVAIHKQGSDDVWHLDVARRNWQRWVKPKLTERELDVLRLHAQGLTIHQIADQLCISGDTVKYHRRRIFESFEVSSMVEDLSYAVHNRLL